MTTWPIAWGPACPVGAIYPDGYFGFADCDTHNDRDFVGCFGDRTGTLQDFKRCFLG